jgi:hypothetical protein
VPTRRLVAAIVDQVTFNAHIIETGTESYRLRTTKARQAGLPTRPTVIPIAPPARTPVVLSSPPTSPPPPCPGAFLWGVTTR